MTDCCDNLLKSKDIVPKKTIDTCLLMKAVGNKFRLNCEKFEKKMLIFYGK